MILFTHYGAIDDISGVTSWLQNLVSRLHQEGEPVCLRIHHFGNDPSEGSLLQDALAKGIDVSAVPIPTTTRQSVRDILKFLNHKRPAVFVPQALPGAHFAARLAEKSGLPWIFTIHSDDPIFWALADHAAPSKAQGAWVAVSESIAADARHKYPQADIRVIPYGVTKPPSTTQWNPKQFRVVFSGRIVEEQKQVSKVLDVLLLACRQSPMINAVFLGDGPERAKLEQRVLEAGMASRIRFLGRLTVDAVKSELLLAQAMILMSDYEGLPVALLEAMACGVVPVVKNIRSGIPEIVHEGKTGRLLSDDIAASAAILLDLANSPESWACMSTAARNLISQSYLESACHKKWQDLIHELEARSQVRYPIPVPRFPAIPPFDQRLAAFDCRNFPWNKSLRGYVKKAIKTLTKSS
jgi:colanic acid/amylovoran biosynthesis glycosyltransferase